MRRPPAATVFGLLLALLASPAGAYESGTTHPGLTARAMIQSGRLHPFLRQDLGLGLGLFTRLRLLPTAIPPRDLRALRHRLASLDAGGGFRPDADDGQRATGWLMAGSVLAGMPAAIEEDHFYSPVLKTGLDNSRPVVGWLLGALSVVEGGDRVRQFLTGTGFDLQGTSALDLVRAPQGAYGPNVIYGHLAEAVVAADPRSREHHLAMGLVALGGLLHVLQDMASPTRTRNDFVPGQLQQLGNSSFDRGSAYERAVALAYGQLGLPRYHGPTVVRRHLLDFFTSPSWQGLADHTAAEHFSPGTVPPALRLSAGVDADELQRRLSSRLPFSQPALGRIDLRCARRRTCHLRGPHGSLLAYRVDTENRLQFFIDQKCIGASARHLLPMAVGYSAGAIDFLFRGHLGLETRGKETLLRNGGVALGSGRLRIVVEDGRGQRRVLETRRVPPTQPDGLLTTIRSLPTGGQRLLALLEGIDPNGEPLLAVAHLAATSQGPGFSATDIGVQSPPASAPAAQPAPTSARTPTVKKGPKPGKAPPRLDLVPPTKKR